MKTILKHIALNERSYNVTLLHKALEALGLPVAKNEVAQGKAGKDTLKKVRTLQAQLNVPVDHSTLVNDATSLAIAESLYKRGLTAASRSFTVIGTVRLRNGKMKKRQRLLAFDLDLRGVGVFRNIKKIAEIQKARGFEFLGETVSDVQGNYSLTIYDWQYRQVDREKATVVVYALIGEEIIGCSGMVNSEDYSDKGLVNDLDIIITQEDKLVEYGRLMSELNAFLKEGKTSLGEIATSPDQLVFTAAGLDVDRSRINIAAGAELLAKQEEKKLSHELLYGIGRQNISLSWAALYKKQEEELRKAIAKSVDERIIREFNDKEIKLFLKAIRECSVKHKLKDKKKEDKNSLNAMLSNALPEEKQRFSFVDALGNFKGSDFREFWNKHLPAQPEFKDKPELVSGILLTQQLTLLTGNHQSLVKELQVNRKLTSMHQLFEFEKSDWLEIINKTGMPDFIEGKNDEDKIDRYADLMQCMLNAAFPTQRIAKMVEEDKLCIENINVSKSIGTFLSNNEQFDFARSNIHDFAPEIEAVAGGDLTEVSSELMKIQRVFQVSTSPEAMTVLLENKLHSAYTIANIPRKSFIKTYGNALGGEDVAFAIHQRASHISAKAEMNVMHIMDYSHGATPRYVMGKNEYDASMAVLQNKVPNYTELFGSPDICECEHCRSVYSPAAYYIDLLRFLWRGEPNSNGKTPLKTPLDMLAARRPDLLHLPLTCENTNTIIPYIDLANEVMEYYTAYDSLTNFQGYDTREATSEELRANPQNFNLEAYRKLKDAKYPFTLLYHQPLDVIRTYSNHLKVSRYEALKNMNPQPDAVTTKAIGAESLSISNEEYTILTGEAFDGTADTTQLHEYFGFTAAGELEEMSKAHEFLQRSGIAYTDLVELVKNQFINPYQSTLDFLKKIFSCASIDANTVYTKLGQIEAGTLDPANDADIMAALNLYNSANETSVTAGEFAQWVKDHLGEFRRVITLYEPESKCDLETTRLRTIQSIYEGLATSGITNDSWARIHRFIRLWRKLGWTIHETDLILGAIGEDNITTETISKLESVSLLNKAAKQPLNQLAVCWGNIDIWGEKSLYKKLFLNKSVQKIDEAFKDNVLGNYLQDETEILADHQPAILAAFRMTEEDLNAILEIAQVIDGGKSRSLNMDSDILNIQNLSTIYRYVVLAKALKMQVADLCRLIGIFNASPFSTWDIQQEKFVNISPANTYGFYKLAGSAKEAGFKSSVLEYILRGTLPADSGIGLDKDKILQKARDIRDAFASIEQDHPETPGSPLTVENLAAKLSLTFKPEVVKQFMGVVKYTSIFTINTESNLPITIPADLATKYSYIGASGSLTCKGIMTEDEKNALDNLDGATERFKNSVNELYHLSVKSTFECDITFATITDKDLPITIPDELVLKYTYIKGSGRLTCAGIMSDAECVTLKGLANASANFQTAVEELYEAPGTFLRNNFNGIFSDPVEASAKLLNQSAHVPAATLDEKLDYVYKHFLPLLKSKLCKDTITQHIAALIGLSEEATAVLIAGDVENLIKALSTEGFSADYFSDATWGAIGHQGTDATVDFAWGSGVPADTQSVRWEAYVAAPASGEYRFVVDAEELDEIFKLYLDDTLIREKTEAGVSPIPDGESSLNATRMHLLRFDYAEISHKGNVRLQWKTATTSLEVVPASVAYPFAILNAFVAQATAYHRAAKFISGFEISETELDHFINFHADFDNIDFKALTVNHWKRIRDYTILRNAVPQAQALLTDVFALANTPDPAPTVDQLTEMLRLATAWDKASLDYLVRTHFTLSAGDFKNEIALNRLYEVMQIVVRTGISAETIAEWGSAETDFDMLHNTSQLIKNTVKAKYEEEEWLDVAKDLSNKIRENQKHALISYLLMQPAIRGWGAEDADGLFEYFLIDVQIGACMDTSRIVQANSSVQMFVNRCLLNLESDMSGGSENGVSPGAIDKDRWDWMKNYRVWEANRKVFLYPENWLEPEWRNDRSEFFKELESFLLQNDITERSVEQGFRNYLTSLNEVANPEVCGMCQENYDDGKLKYLHVFARTHNAPYKFFYRTWNEFRKWSPWEKVQLDIRSVENGDNSGVHLIPVVWKKRLFLFWPEFMEKQEAPSGTDNKSVAALGSDPNTASSLKPIKSWEIRLAWSEYVDGKWSPKQVSKEFIEQNQDIHESSIPFATEIDSGDKLYIYLLREMESTDLVRYWYVESWFGLADIASKVKTGRISFQPGIYGVAYEQWGPQYGPSFMNLSAYSNLQLLDDVYLESEVDHKLLLTPDFKNYDHPSFDEPFFFSDAFRTYFVRPVNIRINAWIAKPKDYKPFIADYWLNDFMAEEGIASPFSDTPIRPAMMISSGIGATGETSGLKSVSKNSVAEISKVEGAFGTFKDVVHIASDFMGRLTKGLEFHTFYHPFSSKYITYLNQGGLSRGNKGLEILPGLMESDTEISSDKGDKFKNVYVPNFNLGLVQPSLDDFQKNENYKGRTYYKENVCFDVYGANSLYNWELFFHAPLYIATRLSKNGKFEEAMKWFHYIFDPTTDEMPKSGESEISRYWKVPPFKNEPTESLEDWFRKLNKETDQSSPDYNPDSELSHIVSEWRDNPFDPHLVAGNRPLAYMKHVVIKYVENLIAWGDSLFRRDTMESVNEALQIYVLANHILGPYPEFVPKRGEIKAESYYSLRTKWDDFSNALVEVENIFPYSSEVSVSSISTGTNLLGIGPALYFCIPYNDKLLEYWDTVADRLFKIRHCQNLDGVERKLALFAPPISPAALIQAASKGLSLGSILADLSSPPPIYRFTYLIQKANEFCAEVKALGSALLATLEKKDGEELSRLRASHETNMLELITAIRERQVLDAKANKENLLKARKTAAFRLQHYIDILGNDSVTVPAEPTVNATLTADSQLPVDTSIATIKTDVDESLVDSDERGVKLIPKEKEDIDKINNAKWWQIGAGSADTLAGIFNMFVQGVSNVQPLGVGAGVVWGGINLGNSSSAVASGLRTISQLISNDAMLAAKMASYIRREQDWTLQANLAAREIIQLDKQITSADIRIQVAEKELENHKQQIENTKEVELFLKDKFTNQELYQWMKEQLFAVYKQSYNLAFDMAKKTEKAYKYEMGTETSSFIQYGYWDNSMQGLVSGEKLQLALRQLEKSYLEENRRELELTKSISLAMLNPLALIELRETGKCYVSLPEELLDLDFQGHYFRRIKSVSLSIPCIAGPFTTVNCSLRLLNNNTRVNTSMNSEGKYEHENDAGLWIDDDRFRTSNVPVTSIATSTGQNDAGMFEFNFRDERYLPFEGAGAISNWQIELSTEKELRQFDYSTISDVILHLKFTARENGGMFKEKAVAYIKDFIMNAAELPDQPLMRMFSMKHEFPSEWHRFLHPSAVEGEQVLNITIGKERMPFFTQLRKIIVMRIDVLARTIKSGDYYLDLSVTDTDNNVMTSKKIPMHQKPGFGNLQMVSLAGIVSNKNLEDISIDEPKPINVDKISIDEPISLWLSSSKDFTPLDTNPDEAKDILLVFHYKLGEEK